MRSCRNGVSKVHLQLNLAVMAKDESGMTKATGKDVTSRKDKQEGYRVRVRVRVKVTVTVRAPV